MGNYTNKKDAKPNSSDQLSHQKKQAKSDFAFKDKRSETIQQQEFQEKANNSPETHKAIQLQKSDNNSGLPDQLKLGIENLSGHSMDDVKVHYDSNRPTQLNAHAYAQGNQIHLASGQEKHLPHEAWHVVQQKQGRVKPTIQAEKQININDDEGLEKEADTMGEKALQMKVSEDSSHTVKTSFSSSTIQRAITNVVKDDLPRIIFDLATAYNLLGNETTITNRINSLSLVEHEIYKWLTTNKAPDMNEVDGAKHVQALMNSVKSERAIIISKSTMVDKDQDSQDAGLPIAGFKDLSEQDQTEVRAMWKGLIDGSDNIKINTKDSDKQETHIGFKLKVLLEFSRLLEGRYGREMIKEINSSDQEIVIEPFYKADKKKSFAAGPTSDEQDSGSLKKLDAPPSDELLQYYPETNISNMDEKARRNFFNKLKPTQDGQLGAKIVDGNSTTYFKFGEGSAVKVTMPSDLSDSSQEKESRLADKEGNELSTPVFITLGHELGHGLHMQKGTVTKDTEIPNTFDDNTDKQAYLGDQEEYINIEENENSLREEHGLGKRKGHINIPYLQKQKMETKINELYEWYDNLGSLKELKVYKDIDKLITKMYNRIYTEWDQPDKLEEIKVEFGALPAAIQQKQVDFIKENFSEHVKKEYWTLYKAFYKKSFSFNTGVDIPVLMDGLDREIEYEISQAKSAAQTNSLGLYLQTLPKQRKDYVNGRISKKLDDLGDASDGNQEDKKQHALMTKTLNHFIEVDWIFNG